MGITTYANGYREFEEEHTHVHDEQRSGRSSVFDETIVKIKEAMLKDRN